MSIIQKSKTSNAWHVLYVRSKHEKSIHDTLQEKGIKSSLPVITVHRQWSDRKKKIQIPLFRGYVFVYIDFKKQRLDVLHTDGVVKFITFGSNPAEIPEVQMYWLDKLLTTSNVAYEQEFPVNSEVEVFIGPFKGLSGRVKQKKSETRLVVWFDAIMQGVSIDIDPTYLKGRKQKSIDYRATIPLATNRQQ